MLLLLLLYLCLYLRHLNVFICCVVLVLVKSYRVVRSVCSQPHSTSSAGAVCLFPLPAFWQCYGFLDAEIGAYIIARHLSITQSRGWLISPWLRPLDTSKFNFRSFKQIIIIVQVRLWWPAVRIAILDGPLTLQHYYWLSQQNKQKTLKLTRVTQTIGHFGKYHNTLCLPPQILHKHCF